MVVTATRSATRLRDAPAISYVVDSVAIDRTMASRASDALGYVPGVDVECGTGVGLPSKKSISLNGLPSFHTVVLVDGHRLLSSHFHTGANVDIVPPGNIERIEVLKDASSAQYGSDALGGVVNIITKRGSQTPSLELEAAGGSCQSLRGGISLTGATTPKVFHSVYAGWDQSEGIPITEGRRKDMLGWKHLSLMDRFDFHVANNARLGASVHYAGFMDLQSGDLFYNGWLLTPGVDWGWDITPKLAVNGQFYYTRWNADISHERNELASPELWLSWSGLPYNRITLGGDFQWRSFARDGVLEQDQRLLGAFLQDELSVANWLRVLGALRLDYVDNTAEGSEDNGPRLSPKLSLLARPVDALGIRASVGSGFRAPSVQDLYESRYHSSGGGIWRYGNDALDPERSVGVNAGLDWHARSWLQAGVNGYYNDLSGMIALVRAPRDTVYNGRTVPIWERRNVNDYRIGGFEVWTRASSRYVGLDIGATATWQDSDDPKAAEALLYPGHKLHAAVDGKAPLGKALELDGFVGVQYVFNRRAPTGDGALADYTRMESGLALTLLRKYELYVKATNLLAQEIEMYEDALWTLEGVPLVEAGVRLKVF